MKFDNGANLAEYNAINSRLENFSNAQNALFIFAFSATGAILPFSLQQSNPYISLINLLVLIAVRCRVMWFRNARFNELAYLRVIVEPSLKLDSKAKVAINPEGISKVHYFIYTFLGVGSILTYRLNNPDNVATFMLGITLLIVVFFLDFYYVFSLSVCTAGLKSNIEIQNINFMYIKEEPS